MKETCKDERDSKPSHFRHDQITKTGWKGHGHGIQHNPPTFDREDKRKKKAYISWWRWWTIVPKVRCLFGETREFVLNLKRWASKIYLKRNFNLVIESNTNEKSDTLRSAYGYNGCSNLALLSQTLSHTNGQHPNPIHMGCMPV